MSRIFKECEFKKECPICGQKHTGDGMLIGIDGTEEGNNIEAELVHVDCLNLRLYKDKMLIAQIIHR